MEVLSSHVRSEPKPSKLVQPAINCPEVVEEFQKDADGRITSVKYMKGKLLGKVIYMYSYSLFNIFLT